MKTKAQVASQVRVKRCNALRNGRIARQAGVFAVEFGIIVIMFFTILFMIMEIARVLYVWNTLQEVTRRAAREASVTDFSDANAMAKVRQNAVFRGSAGSLALSAPVTDDYVRIEYMSIQSESNSQLKKVAIPTSSLPGCPARNVVTCTAKSGDASCIRLVRVRICAPGSEACNPIPYQSLFSLVQFPVNLPKAETIAPAESLGYMPGMPMCK